ncbi:helix-turn-helix domain-containing protein [Lentibacillus sp. Marseille-P4043]|uniref:helix-turn-helix domain-containing protein n=1 Tax=Lentibacillus sp. Marseille-P4043 TaxID=2040293 RepID=UPI000D0B0BF9|nr:helix-turn-helix transcriptional regulator [Lentibacillus sp. Marseille-P4043]
MNNTDIAKGVISDDNIVGSFGYLVEKICNFHVLYINNTKETHDSRNILKVFSKDIVRGQKANIPIFRDRTETDTFIIWEQSYQENKDLFLKLRFVARDNLIIRIATIIVADFLEEYKNIIGISMYRHPKLKDKTLLDKAIKKIELLLRNETFLADDTVWENFCGWFKSYLTDWVLDDMVKKTGYTKLVKLDPTKLNELFYNYLTKHLKANGQFMVNFRKVVEYRVQNWIKKIISNLDVENLTISEINNFLDLNNSSLPINNAKSVKNDITFTLIDKGNLLVMSNVAYQSVRETISNKRFDRSSHSPFPTAQISKNTIEGIVQIKPYSLDKHDLTVDETGISESWRQAKEMSELDADVLDALCSFYLANSTHHQDIVEIYLDDLLSIRGLKPKLSGSGRRGGYENEQRSQILKALSRIQNLWIDLEKAVVYEKGKPMQKTLKGRTFVFFNQDYKEYDISKQPLEKLFRFTVDEVFAKYLNGSGRQVAMLPVQALQYNPYQEVWKKKLIRYLSWRWRTQARKGDYLQPHKISSLLDAIGKKMNIRTPSRTRDRLEHALDSLTEAGLIASWQYEKWDESIVSSNGWARIWANSTILIDPPKVIKEKYSAITRAKSVRSTTTGYIGNHSGEEKKDKLGKQMKAIRKRFGLTLLQVADDLEVSVSYLSNIERDIKTPSNKINNRIINWLQRYEDSL